MTPNREPRERAYWLGWVTGIAFFLAIGWSFRAATLSHPLRLEWSPSVVDWVDQPLLQGQPRRFTQELINRGRGTVRLEELVSRKEFVKLIDPPAEQLPLKLRPGTSRTVTWEVLPAAKTWGVHEVELFGRVANQTDQQSLRSVLALQAAGWVNPEPNHWSFGRVGDTNPPPIGQLRLWVVAGGEIPDPCVVTSTDPAITVKEQPLELVAQGRHYFLELELHVDPRRAQARHCSFLEVTSAGKTPVQIAILGWSDLAPVMEVP